MRLVIVTVAEVLSRKLPPFWISNESPANAMEVEFAGVRSKNEPVW